MSFEQLEELPIMDRARAAKDMGDEDLFAEFLAAYEQGELNNHLIGLKTALDAFDYGKVRSCAYALKGTSGYLHAERVTAAAQRLHEDVDLGLPDRLMHDYPILIKQCIILKRQIRQELAALKGTHRILQLARRQMRTIGSNRCPLEQLF